MILNKILEQSAINYSDKTALTMKMGYRTVNMSYKEVYELSKKIAVFLEKNGVDKGDRVLICAPNSPYWICVFWATMLRGAIIVPLNIQSTKGIIDRIAQQTEAKILFKHIFFKQELPADIKQFNIEFIPELVQGISSSEFKKIDVTQDDLVQIMYTSGTTGDPKGVMLTHENLYSNLNSVSKVIIVDLQKDKILSILPLSHIFEQIGGFLLPFWRGVHIVYTHSYAAIRPLMKQHKITKLIAVPEFLQIMISRIEAEAQAKGRKKYFDKFIQWSEKINNRFISRLLFHSVIKALGGKLDTIASGGAPLDINLEKKWDALGVEVLQGYGLTETSPVVTTNNFNEKRLGSVGKVIPGVEVKIDKDGEILVKGPNVFVGYYKNEQKTKEAFNSDGWFKTGDLGEFDKDGFLFIKGRKKYMIKSSGGQNVYPEDIENELNHLDGVKESCVIGLEKPSGAVEIHAVLLLDPNKNVDPQNIIDDANKELATYQHISGWSVWSDIDFPRTATRKIKKEEVRKYLEGQKQDLTKVSQAKKSKIIQILSQVTNTDSASINDTTKMSELHLDSLMRVELVAWIEESLNVMVDETEIMPSTTVLQLEGIVQAKKPIKEASQLKSWPRSKWILPIRFIGQQIFFLLMMPFVRLKVQGKDNLKKITNPVIFMPNHISFADSIIVAMALPWSIRKNLAFAAARDFLYEKYKFFTVFTEAIFCSFPIQREGNENIKLGLDFIGQVLDQNYSVVIFPEGRTSENGQLQELRRGAGLVAVEMHVQVIPIKIVGSSDVVPYGKIFPRKRGDVIVKFGEPIKFKASESYAVALEKITESIKSL